LITAIVERRLKNIDEFVGFNNLQTVRFRLGWIIALANAKCFLFKFTAGSTIAKPEPKSEGTATGTNASDLGGTNTASVVRSNVSFDLVMSNPTNSS